MHVTIYSHSTDDMAEFKSPLYCPSVLHAVIYPDM